ncbi:helix-turn-helix transcriptional regulator [Streptomyces sp. NPDC006992]|uniref:helix-turn-helix domain-containing protein n=1 Tax=Streptomyces sp. NPDC006992 TaxID=3155601 RepID=UPI003403A1B7
MLGAAQLTGGAAARAASADADGHGVKGREHVKDVRNTGKGRTPTRAAGKKKAEAGGGNGPDLPGAWTAYGVLLQHFRRLAGLSQKDLGEAIGYSLEQVASVEQGRRPAKEAFTTAADRVLEARGALVALQPEVDRAKLPPFFRNFALIEADVVSRFSYDPLLVPGLLQTEAYARAVFAGHCPPPSEEEVDQLTEARLARQKLLARVPLAELSFIVGEEVLRDPVGDAQVMRGQLEHLLKVVELRNVAVQVMPARRGFHTGMNGPFVVVETQKRRQLGYFESQGVGCVVQEADVVSDFGMRYGKLRSQALNVEESARLIGRIAGET